MKHPPKNRPAKASQRHSQDADGEIAGVRIIGGTLGGRHLEYSGDLRTRPMKDRVRESVFNLVGPAIAGTQALDLFAGTGALGLEAISRGAISAILIERHYPTSQLIKQNAQALGIEDKCEVVFGDAFLWARKQTSAVPSSANLKSLIRNPKSEIISLTSNSRWLVFCSPPYEFYVSRLTEMLELIGTLWSAAPIDSLFIVEADERFDYALLPDKEGWDVRTYLPASIGLAQKEIVVGCTACWLNWRQFPCVQEVHTVDKPFGFGNLLLHACMFLRRQFLLALATASVAASTGRSLIADDPSAISTDTTAEPFTPSPEFQALITRLAREQLPDKYEKTKNWGKTTRVFDGWKVERDGIRLETRRRFKQANDGAWQKYTIELLDPEHSFVLRVTNLRQQESQVVCDVAVIASARVHGRHTQWENGVQLLSIGAVADARLQLRAQLAMSMKLDPTKFPPDIALVPRVTQADLDILDFKLQRISHFGGPVVKSLSSSVREALEDKFAESRPQLVERLNKSLAKQDAKLRFSATDWLSALKKQPSPAHAR